MEDRFIRIEEVALVLGVNSFSIDRWYKFKRENPKNEYAQILPEFVYKVNSKNRPVRYWKISDIPALKQFQESIIPGVKGFMGPSNLKKKESEENGKKKTNRSRRSKSEK